MARVAPSERFRAQLDEVLAGVGQQQDPVETIGRLGARLILQQALEDEVTESSAGAPTSGAKRRSLTATATSRGGSPQRAGRSSSSAPRLRDASKLGFEGCDGGRLRAAPREIMAYLEGRR